jgi:oligogalacturonide lyase
VTEYRDEKTGARVRVLTPGEECGEVVYQTHPMWTPGMTHLLFNSYRTDGKRLPHALDMANGAVKCLAPGGADDCTLSRRTPVLFMRKGDAIEVVPVADSRGSRKTVTFEGLAAIKPMSMSADMNENVLYFGVTIEADKKWGVTAVDLANGTRRNVVEVNFKVGHVQANPFKPGMIMFCHETGGDAPQRTWVAEVDVGFRPFYRETYEEWVTHEVWWGPDHAIFTIWPYDKAHRSQPHGVVSADLATGTPTVHAQYPAWHTHGSPDRQWALGDDFDRNIWLIKVATGERRLLTQGHNGEGFDTHPHASFTPDGKAIVFNSSKLGSEDVMLVEIPEWDSLPEPE